MELRELASPRQSADGYIAGRQGILRMSTVPIKIGESSSSSSNCCRFMTPTGVRHQGKRTHGTGQALLVTQPPIKVRAQQLGQAYRVLGLAQGWCPADRPAWAADQGPQCRVCRLQFLRLSTLSRTGSSNLTSRCQALCMEGSNLSPRAQAFGKGPRRTEQPMRSAILAAGQLLGKLYTRVEGCLRGSCLDPRRGPALVPGQAHRKAVGAGLQGRTRRQRGGRRSWRRSCGQLATWPRAHPGGQAASGVHWVYPHTEEKWTGRECLRHGVTSVGCRCWPPHDRQLCTTCNTRTVPRDSDCRWRRNAQVDPHRPTVHGDVLPLLPPALHRHVEDTHRGAHGGGGGAGAAASTVH